MKIPMTFQELLNEYSEDDIFPIEIDDALRETIKDWFKYRRLCVVNAEKFIVYFQRTLLANYLRYRELLRIEPGISKFDWLVETYREMQNTRLATVSDEEVAVLSGSITGQTTGSKNSSQVEDGTIADTISNTRTNNLSEVIDDTEVHSGIDSREKTDERTDNLTKSRDIDDETTRTDNLASSSQGSSSSEDHYGAYHTEISKTNPMSASYGSNPVSSSAMIPNGDNGQMIGTLDYQYLDGQALSNDKNNSKTTGSDTNSTTNTGTQKHVTDRTDVLTETGTTTHDITDELTHGHTVDRDRTKSNTGTVSDSGSKSRDIDDTKTITETTGGTKSETTSGRNTKNNEQAIDDLIRERSTGRQTEIAKLLKRASEYISVTSAWLKFLKPQLEPCFYGTYVEEDDDE